MRRKARGLALGLLLLHGSAGMLTAADRSYPIQGITPREDIGGAASIPGFPFGAVSKESAKDAISIYKPMVLAARLLSGPDSPAVARGTGYLAGLHAAVGETAEAERLYGEARKILEKQGKTGLDLGWVHNNQGLARLHQQRYAGAVASFRAAVGALAVDDREALEPRAIVLQNLAAAHHLLGDLESSEPAYLKALDMLRRLGRERDREYQTTSQNLAILHLFIGDFAEARKILEGVVTRGGIRSPSLRFAVLNNLGEALRGLDEFRAAEARLQEAAALTSPGSRERVLVLMNLAATHSDAGDFEKSRQEAEQALRIVETLYGPESPSAAAIQATLGTTALDGGDLPEADRLLSKAKSGLTGTDEGKPHALAKINQVLAMVAQRRGRRERALDLSRQALDLEIRNLDQILAFGSEAQRLAYQSNAFPYDYLANLGEATLLAEAVLRFKGAVLDSLLAERALVRRSTDPAARERLDRIHTLKVLAMEQTAREGAGGGTRLDEIARELKQEETALAKSLSGSLRPERPRADLARVQASLANNQVLVEIVRFQLYASGGKLIPHYGAVVIPRQGRPSWIVLGRAGDVEDRVERLVKNMGGGGRGVQRAQTDSPENEVTGALQGLHGLLWKPLAKVFPAGTQKVLLSPDGALCFVPWPALLDENKTFAAERWQISQVSTGRDLVRKTAVSADKTLLALADGKGDLPFSKQEVERLARIAGERGWQPTVLIGPQASESELFKRRGPRILHLATHGGLLGGDFAEAIEARLGKQPMYRGYLLLGGAEESLAAWKRGSVTPFPRDGILTAEEVGGLDLGRTWLTVLSACQTGSGEARSGEGVLGLRRGFALAGTEYLLFTLWPVDDRATARFMETFYQQLFQTGDPALAFHNTQRAELHRLRQEHGFRGAVFQAGGLVLTR